MSERTQDAEKEIRLMITELGKASENLSKNVLELEKQLSDICGPKPETIKNNDGKPPTKTALGARLTTILKTINEVDVRVSVMLRNIEI